MVACTPSSRVLLLAAIAGSLALVADASGVDGRAVSCQRLGMRVSRVGLDGAVKDIVWLTGQVVFIMTAVIKLRPHLSRLDVWVLNKKPIP